jgi:hypothetical protein
MSDDQEREVTSAGTVDVFRSLGQLVGKAIGTLVALALAAALVLGSGLAVGRAVDLLQGAVPRPLQDMTTALDGWAVLFAAYVLLWLPIGAVARVVTRRRGEGEDLDDDY